MPCKIKEEGVPLSNRPLKLPRALEELEDAISLRLEVLALKGWSEPSNLPSSRPTGRPGPSPGAFGDIVATYVSIRLSS